MTVIAFGANLTRRARSVGPRLRYSAGDEPTGNLLTLASLDSHALGLIGHRFLPIRLEG